MSLVPFRPQDTAPEPAEPNHWIDLVAPAADLAKMIAATEFVPAEMRNKPATVAACILYGAEIGIGPMQALAKVDMVKGRPAPRAELARALALGAGHQVWVDESTNTRVTVTGKRRNSEHVMSVTWTMDDAKRAGLAGGNYAKYPRQMLLARASAELVRQMCPDVLGGITMFAEEADDPANNEPAATPAAEPVKATTRRRATSTPGEPAALPAATLPPLPGEEPDTTDGLATPAQIQKMIVVFNKLSITQRDDRISVVVSIIGRPVGSSKECTVDEASQVIDALERVESGALELQYVDGVVSVGVPESAGLPALPFEDEQG